LLELALAAELRADDVLTCLDSTLSGLSADEVGVRVARIGPNVLRSHGARPLAVFMRQLRNPMLVLLVAAALTSLIVGERTSALIILAIICMSVGLGFFNEYRSELAVEALHSQLRHTALSADERAADRTSPPRPRTLDPPPRHPLDHPGRPAASRRRSRKRRCVNDRRKPVIDRTGTRA